MSTSIFQLPHLYHRPGTGAGQIEASSMGLTQAHWEEFRRLAPLLPPPQETYPQGVLGLYRGQTMDFILAHAHIDATGKPGVHYVLMVADALRQTAGRARMLLDIADASALKSLTREMAPLSWATPAAPTLDEQVDDLSAFMLMLNDDFKIVAGLLGALIQGIPVTVINGPRELGKQLAFVQGFLTLLPVPARFGATFSTYVHRLKETPVQIAFMASASCPENTLCFDWAAGVLRGTLPGDDPYSHYIIQQLRLDPSVAVQQMVALTRPAGWRLSQKDSLNQALGWAARRAALDAAVSEGQPADGEMVASILRDDPTLSDDLRVRYVRHLLAFILVLNDTRLADVIGPHVHGHSDVEDVVLTMLSDAVAEGKVYLVFRLIMGWMALPDGPDGSAWREQAYAAAESYLQTLVAVRNTEQVIAFFEELQAASEKLMVGELAPRLIDIALPVVGESTELAQTLFLLAVDHLSALQFQRLVRTGDFTRRLPEAFQRALVHFQADQQTAAPPGLLARVAAEFGEEWSLMVLARLLEWTVALQRVDLFDTPTLAMTVALAQSPWRIRFQSVLAQIVAGLERSSLLILLDEPGPEHVVEIALQLGDYRQVVNLLERLSATLFRGDAQADFAPWVSDIFQRSRLDTTGMLAALPAIAQFGLKPLPMVMAFRGALLNRGFGEETYPLVQWLTQTLSQDAKLFQPVGYDVAVKLVQVHSKRQDAENALLLSSALVASLEGAEEGLSIVGRLWMALNWNDDVREAALELMRRYVRQVPPERAARIPAQVGRKLGPKVEAMLQATVMMSVMTGGEAFERWADDLNITTTMLTDIISGYVQKPYPTLHRLRSDLDAMSGGVSDQDRQKIANDILATGRLVFDLGRDRGKGRGRTGFEQKLIAGTEAPRSAVDALLWIGGHLASGQTIKPNLEREAVHHVLGRRSVIMLRDEIAIIRRTLEQIRLAVPADKPVNLPLEAFHAEVDSLWKSLGAYDQQRMREDFAADAQTLAVLIGMIADEGDERALTDSSMGRGLELGKRDPRSALDVMRMLYGYFMRLF